jgi:hypothetical protein
MEPAGQRTRLRESLSRLCQKKKHCLKRIIRVSFPKNMPAHTEDMRSIAANQFGERRFVALNAVAVQ